MAFIYGERQGEMYAPGWFLAHEECVRVTKQISSAGVTADVNGFKHVKGGTAYPSNDGNAIGIVYEDVDVTAGDMPGSVVTKGVVYEGRLSVTGAQYDGVTLKNLVSPKEQGWQERSGTEGSYVYADSTDTTVNTSKTYYEDNESHTAVSDYAAVLNPSTEGWYERSGTEGSYVYTLSTDTAGDKTKTYYEKTDIRLASAAKSALEGKGFVFVTEPTVTRP